MRVRLGCGVICELSVMSHEPAKEWSLRFDSDHVQVPPKTKAVGLPTDARAALTDHQCSPP